LEIVNASRAFERSVMDDTSLSSMQKALLVTDGTVTQLLEVFAREEIRVKKLGQSQVQGGPALLAAGDDEPVISRRILLCGDRRAYLHATSWLVPARMPREMQAALTLTDAPIGQLWKAARLETFREIVDFRPESNPEISGMLGSTAGLLSRSYLVNTGGRPMALVVERFPADLFT
jgi:chorismate-pyruvate lyase